MAVFSVVVVAAVWGGAYALCRVWVADRHATREHQRRIRTLELDVERERIASKAAVRTERDARAKQELSLREREVALQERVKAPPSPVPEWPADVRAIVQSWDEDWAKNDMEKIILNAYGTTQDWNAVRAELAPYMRTEPRVTLP